MVSHSLPYTILLIRIQGNSPLAKRIASFLTKSELHVVALSWRIGCRRYSLRVQLLGLSEGNLLV